MECGFCEREAAYECEEHFFCKDCMRKMIYERCFLNFDSKDIKEYELYFLENIEKLLSVQIKKKNNFYHSIDNPQDLLTLEEWSVIAKECADSCSNSELIQFLDLEDVIYNIED